MNLNLRGTLADVHQCVQLQRIAAVKAAEANVSVSDFVDLVASWDRLQERKRILKGRPKPAAAKPEKTGPKRRNNASELISVPSASTPQTPAPAASSSAPGPAPGPASAEPGLAEPRPVQ